MGSPPPRTSSCFEETTGNTNRSSCFTSRFHRRIKTRTLPMKTVKQINDELLKSQTAKDDGKHDPTEATRLRLQAYFQFWTPWLTILDPLNGFSRTPFEPPRVCRRPFGLSYAAMVGCSSMA